MADFSKLNFGNSRGQSLILMIIIIGMVAYTIMGVIGYATRSIENIEAQTQALEQPRIFENEINTILSNNQLCAGTLQINGSNFSLPNFIEPAPSPKSVFLGGLLNVVSMTIGNVDSTHAPLMQADLTVNYTFFNPNYAQPLGKKYVATIQYVKNGTSVSQCAIVSGLQQACTGLGFSWLDNPAPARCSICEGSGGVWNGSVCTF